MSTVEDNIKAGIEEKGWKVGMKSITQLLLIICYILGQKTTCFGR